MKGTVPYTGKAGSLIFVSCDVTHRDTGKPAENNRKCQCVRAVWDNLRLLLTDFSINRSFGREASLNRVSFWLYKADVVKSSALRFEVD